MSHRLIRTLMFLLLAWLVVGVAAGSVSAQKRTSAVPGADLKPSSYHPVSIPGSASYYYRSVWGIDDLTLRLAASGTLIRFSYRIVNPVRAAMLGNKRAEPYLVDERSRVVLRIPVTEQVGPLWQSRDLEKGKKYWMAFSNKGHPVQVGHRVNVVIGTFHADGLMVQ